MLGNAPTLPSVMSHDFSKVPQAEIQRSSFNRSSGLKTTFDAGYLIPIFVDEVLPGDTFNLNAAGFGRLATPIHPIMDNMKLDTFFFFVPNRLLWDNWERFNGAQDDPGDSTDFTIPRLNMSAVGGFPEGSLPDYFGLPTGVQVTETLDWPISLPFRAYNLIYNEWFRDQNLISSAVTTRADTNDNIGSYQLQRSAKRHDYFTSCLPFPQKGDAVTLPLSGTAPVTTGLTTVGSIVTVQDGNGTWRRLTADAVSSDIETGTTFSNSDSELHADLTNTTASTINELREAFQVQRMLERDARSGTRYVEIIKSHFGVTSPDSRLQRPEYLGGGTSAINISPVPQTSSTDATTPQGNLSAFGTVGFNRHGFTKSFTEHGYIIGLARARADLTYQQGMDRMWSRADRYDFYWPTLAHLGEQAVLNKEIYTQGVTADDNAVFGYQERFAEYRYKPSKVTGKFRSNATGTLDTWHLSQEFLSLPVLGQTFIEENPPVDRCIAVPTEPHLILDLYFDLKCARPMPLYSVPGLIDHF